MTAATPGADFAEALWRQRKASAGCACTDRDEADCTNLDAGEGAPQDDGNETCGCRCHVLSTVRA